MSETPDYKEWQAETKAKICESLRKHKISVAGAARGARVQVKIVNLWMREDESFAADVGQALFDQEVGWVDRLDKSEYVSAQQFLLTSRFGGDYGTKANIDITTDDKPLDTGLTELSQILGAIAERTGRAAIGRNAGRSGSDQEPDSRDSES